jgi:hypothetical protein
MHRYANGSPATALRVFRYAAAKHPTALLAADFVLGFAECIAAVGGETAARDARSLYERALGCMAAAVRAYHADRGSGSFGFAGGGFGGGGNDDGGGGEVGLDWRGALLPPGPRPVWLAYQRFEVLHAATPLDGGRLRDLDRRMRLALHADPLPAVATAAAAGPEVGAEGGGWEIRTEEELMRLWWRHAPPGLEPSACATAADAALYERWAGLPVRFRGAFAGPNDVHAGTPQVLSGVAIV